MKIISGNSNPNLAKAIAKQLKIELSDVVLEKFADGEIYVEIKDQVRGADVFVIQSTSHPVNDRLMELLILADALKRSSAKRVTAVIPYFGYARQDRKTTPRTAISAKLVANLLTSAGIHRLLTLDLHAGQIQGFFDIPVDNIFANVLFVNHIKKKFKDLKNYLIVSPDIGGVIRARSVAKWLNIDLAVVDKRRPIAGVAEVVNIIGDVKGKNCILIDDIADSCNTITKSAEALKERGAKDIYVYVSHGVFSLNAIDNIEKFGVKEFMCTDSIDFSDKIINSKKIKTIPLAELMAEAISRIHSDGSISDLFLK
jgi:ribose-phosphate pyrophosphokinase